MNLVQYLLAYLIPYLVTTIRKTPFTFTFRGHSMKKTQISAFSSIKIPYSVIFSRKYFVKYSQKPLKDPIKLHEHFFRTLSFRMISVT